MPLVSRLNRGQVKPYASLPRIDWSHPRSKGLVWYAYDYNGVVYDLVSGVAQRSGTPPSRAVTKWGILGNYNGSSNFIFGDGVNPGGVPLSQVTRTAPYSWAAGFISTAIQANGTGILFQGSSTLSSPITLFVPTGANAAVQFFVAESASFTTANGTLTNNVFHTAVCAATGASAQSLYFDGALAGTGSVSSIDGVAANTNTTTKIGLGAVGQSGNTTFWAGQIPFGALWALRIISAADVRDLQVNPWDHLIYPEDEIADTIVGVASGAVSVNLTGVSAAGSGGTPTVTGFANVTLTGASSTSAAGIPTVSAKANVTINGVAATSAANVPTVTGFANVSLTGVQSASAAGTPTETGFGNVTLTGVAAASQVGTITVSVGGATSVTLTGVVSASSAGTPTITGFANIPVTGVAASSSIGSLTIAAAANASVTGVASTSSAGTPTVTGRANVSLTGASAAGSAGNITVSVPGGVNVTLTGVVAASFVGILTTNQDQVTVSPPVLASFVLNISATDDDTGDDIDFTGADVAVAIKDHLGCLVLSATIGSGLTLIDVNTLQLRITPAQMARFCPGSYQIGAVYRLSGIIFQIFTGQLSVEDGVAVIAA